MALATVATSLLALSLATVAWASPTQVEVRVEGKAERLFEGPVLTEGHDVKASSDTQERACDGINSNDPENLVPGPTPTAAAVDAMGLIGETFDGIWYPSYQDYLITRWGPEAAQGAESWSSFVNSTLLNVGGCQYELREGAQVLWAYGLPSPRPLLALYPANGGTCAPPLTAPPRWTSRSRSKWTPTRTPAAAGRPPLPNGLAPRRTRAPKSHRADRRERVREVESGGPGSVTTESQGRASVTFETPGWHRLKATGQAQSAPTASTFAFPRQGKAAAVRLRPKTWLRALSCVRTRNTNSNRNRDPEPEPHE